MPSKPLVAIAAVDPHQRLALVVHELRTPLATIRLALKLLRHPDPAVVLDATAIIERATAAMAKSLRKLADGVRRRATRGKRDP